MTDIFREKMNFDNNFSFSKAIEATKNQKLNQNNLVYILDYLTSVDKQKEVKKYFESKLKR